MKIRPVYLSRELQLTLKIHKWSIWEVEKVQIEYTGVKYRRETKWVYCRHPKTGRRTRFLWYEVEELPNEPPARPQKRIV